jgi:hypothetical protein
MNSTFDGCDLPVLHYDPHVIVDPFLSARVTLYDLCRPADSGPKLVNVESGSNLTAGDEGAHLLVPILVSAAKAA